MNNFRSLIYTVVGIVIFVAVAKFFITLLPYLIIFALLAYLISKMKKFINRRGSNSKSNTYDTYKSEKGYNDTFDSSYEGQVVDVDYKEVNK